MKLLRTINRHWILFPLAAIAASLIFLLFLSPQRGLADQGDFKRVMGFWGLGYPKNVARTETAWQYWFPHYAFGFPRPATTPFSTELVFGGVAVGISKILLSAPEFDIRVLCFVHCMALLPATWFVLRAFAEHGILVRVGVSLTAFLLLTDTGYSLYFNSWYSESASLIFCIFWLGSALSLIKANPARWPHWSCFIISGVLLIGAKTQNVILFFPLAAFAFVISSKHRFTWITLVSFFLISAWTYTHAPNTRANVYNTIFSGILPISPDPRSDLLELNLNPDLAKWKGNTAYSPGPYYDRSQFTIRTNMGTVVRFYLAHPSRVISIMRQSWPLDRSNRLRYLGEYSRLSGKPPIAQTDAFCFWDSFRARLPWPVCILILIFGLSAPLLSRAPEMRIISTLAACAILSAAIGILTDSNEVQKHLLLAHLFWDLTALGCLTALAQFAAIRYQRASNPKATRPFLNDTRGETEVGRQCKSK